MRGAFFAWKGDGWHHLFWLTPCILVDTMYGVITGILRGIIFRIGITFLIYTTVFVHGGLTPIKLGDTMYGVITEILRGIIFRTIYGVITENQTEIIPQNEILSLRKTSILQRLPEVNFLFNAKRAGIQIIFDGDFLPGYVYDIAKGNLI